MGTAGLDWDGLGWAGLGWAGLGWAGLGWAGLGLVGLGRAGRGWTNTSNHHKLIILRVLGKKPRKNRSVPAVAAAFAAPETAREELVRLVKEAGAKILADEGAAVYTNSHIKQVVNILPHQGKTVSYLSARYILLGK